MNNNTPQEIKDGFEIYNKLPQPFRDIHNRGTFVMAYNIAVESTLSEIAALKAQNNAYKNALAASDKTLNNTIKLHSYDSRESFKAKI